jgi:iron complex outermembrane receptor protein
MKTVLKERLLRTSVLAGFAAAGAMAAPAMAQDVEQTEGAQQAPAQAEIIRVTGTRIQAPGVVSNSPITSVGGEEFRLRQSVNVEELIRTLPVAFPAIGPGVNNGQGGGFTVNLRALGSNRNLVLMDGRRIVPFNLAGSVDTNVIPMALLERADFVTGGAAAVYGSDAMSGVVNFVLRNDFEGAELSAQYGVSDVGDAARRRIDATVGGNFDNGRGNAVISVGYTETDELRQGARSFGEFSLNSVTGNRDGSAVAIPALVILPGARSVADGGVGLTGNQQIDLNTGELRSFYEPFNFNPDNYYQTPQERYQLLGRANYEINNHFDVYLDALYVRSIVETQLASSALFGVNADVPIGNPFIPEGMRQQLCTEFGIADCTVGNTETVNMTIGRRFQELGPRLNDFTNTTFQYTIGTRGDLVAGWTYDAYYQYGESRQDQVRGNWGSLSRAQQALGAVSETECIDTSGGCVPLNPFGAEGTVTSEMIDFFNLDSFLGNNVRQDVAHGSITGDLGFASPFATNPVSAAFGYEWRRVEAGTSSDAASQIQGEVLGTGAPTPDRQGTFQLSEFFGEAFVPLVEDRQFFRSLALELGLRKTEFSSGDETDNYWTYKVGGEWSPVDDIRFRAMYQRATRAPSVNELFAPQVSGLSVLATDPCQGSISGALASLCQQTGVPASVIGNLPEPRAGQVNVLTGGNPELGPEVADTYTVGFVFSPQALPGFTLAVDWWRIELDDAISSPSVTDIIEQCYSTAFNPNLTFNAACALVLRSPSSGNLNDLDSQGVVLALDNIGQNQREGVDISATYQFDLADLGADPAMGSIALQFNGTVFTDITNQPTPVSTRRDCLGVYSVACGGPKPEFKSSTRATWMFGDFDASVLWNYIGPVDAEASGFLPAFSSIEAYHYFDLSGGWNVTDELRLNMTVANIFDKEPPIVGNTIGTTAENSGNTFPQSYDVIGRYFTVGARLRF